MGMVTSRVRALLCESCVSGEDWGDIHIDTEVLKQIAPLAQDRRARKSHHLPIVAGLVDEGPHHLDITLVPPLSQKFGQYPYCSPPINNAASFIITATYYFTSTQT